MVGWLSAIGWQVYLAGVAFMVGSVIQGLIALNVQDYVWRAWHGTLLTIAAITFCILFSTVLAAKLPLIEGTVLILHLAGLFAIIIPLWVMAPLGNADDALLIFTNNGGWSSNGLSAMIGLTTPLSVLIGYDCSVHMSEETRDASITLPKAIMWSVALNAGPAFIMAVTLCFTLGDVDSLFESVTRQPFIQIFFNATGSYGGTNAMVSISHHHACFLLCERSGHGFAIAVVLCQRRWPALFRLARPGQSQAQYPTPGRLRLTHRVISVVLHQSWFVHRSQCHQLIGWRLNPVELLRYDLLPHLSPCPRPTSAA